VIARQVVLRVVEEAQYVDGGGWRRWERLATQGLCHNQPPPRREERIDREKAFREARGEGRFLGSTCSGKTGREPGMGKVTKGNVVRRKAVAVKKTLAQSKCAGESGSVVAPEVGTA
jgi:hypothetical protein